MWKNNDFYFDEETQKKLKPNYFDEDMMDIETDIFGCLPFNEEEDQNKEGNIKDTLNIIKLVNIIEVIAEDIEYCREYGAVREQVWKIVLIFDKAT